MITIGGLVMALTGALLIVKLVQWIVTVTNGGAK